METLLTGILLGLSAGIAPGPLLALVISETLQHGTRAGLRVALAPLITDVPIVALTLLTVTQAGRLSWLLGVISSLGAVFVAYLGIKGIRCRGVELSAPNHKSRSGIKGAVTNALSPHPYLFWFSVGAPMTLKACESSILSGVSFVAGFYALLIGSKMTLAAIAGRSRKFLSGKTYIYSMRFLGVALIVFAIILFRDGVRLIGWM